MKSTISLLVSFIPFNFCRIFFYRAIFGHDISYDCRIGMFNVIKCSNLKMRNATIGILNQIIVGDMDMGELSIIRKRNRIKNLNILKVGINVEIGSGNFIGAPKEEMRNDTIKFENQNVYIGNKSAVLRNNYFDVVEEIVIGENVVFGGNGSEIWTHGFDVDRNMVAGKIKFGSNIFVGSSCIFSKNVEIGDNIIVGPGSTIYKSLTEPGAYSTHQINKINTAKNNTQQSSNG